MKTLKFRKRNLLYILLCAVFVISCTNEPKKPTKKPFIITYKFPDGQRCNNGWCSYEYTDANGNVVEFCEDELKYNIGDTIK